MPIRKILFPLSFIACLKTPHNVQLALLFVYITGIPLCGLLLRQVLSLSISCFHSYIQATLAAVGFELSCLLSCRLNVIKTALRHRQQESSSFCIFPLQCSDCICSKPLNTFVVRLAKSSSFTMRISGILSVSGKCVMQTFTIASRI